LSEKAWPAYLIALGLVAAATLLGKFLVIIPVFDPINATMFYIMGVVISSAYLGIGPSMLATFLGVMAFDFFFTLPMLSLVVENQQNQVTLLILFIVSFVISCLSPRIRR
jgi:two-component system, OmpR family, sensor histidine kinase KdpD